MGELLGENYAEGEKFEKNSRKIAEDPTLPPITFLAHSSHSIQYHTDSILWKRNLEEVVRLFYLKNCVFLVSCRNLEENFLEKTNQAGQY